MTTQEAYRYRALRPDGAVEVGSVEAPAREAVSRMLAERGLLPVSVSWQPSLPRRGRVMSWPDLALGLRLLANFLGAGLSLDRALAALTETAPESWRRILPGILDGVRQGRSLGQTLAEASTGVPVLVAALVRSGEAGPGVAQAVERAASVVDSIATTRAAIRQALVYPMVLLVAGVASLAFLTGVVLPRFADILAELGQSPPLTTRIVLAGAQLGRSALLPALATAAAGLVVWRAWTGTPEGLRRWHRLLLDAPLIGRARFALASARAAAAIGSLLESGLTLPRAIGHGAMASADAAVSQALLDAREAVARGESASQALGRENALTPTALRLVRAGEETGRLGQMFLEAGRIEHAGAERLVRGAVQLIEPLFILGFGALVALVAAALLQALYGVRPV